ncbi:hypothetical protein AVEN_62414-1 [Araneus ventricosus]|uniref:Uncharacterized protein n=1 Tax=Araneus ventricosus TaxID=182803 RepID=A0A4Y2MUC7_ARAVE|nr:hypothetical protein AVEN_62414-1 [Araneus ventricosus]
MNIIEDIRDALLQAVEKRSPPPRTPMDLLTALQDSSTNFLQDTFRHQSSSCHVVLLYFCVLWGPDTILRRCTSFFGTLQFFNGYIGMLQFFNEMLCED